MPRGRDATAVDAAEETAILGWLREVLRHFRRHPRVPRRRTHRCPLSLCPSELGCAVNTTCSSQQKPMRRATCSKQRHRQLAPLFLSQIHCPCIEMQRSFAFRSAELLHVLIDVLVHRVMVSIGSDFDCPGHGVVLCSESIVGRFPYAVASILSISVEQRNYSALQEPAMTPVWPGCLEGASEAQKRTSSGLRIRKRSRSTSCTRNCSRKRCAVWTYRRSMQARLGSWMRARGGRG